MKHPFQYCAITDWLCCVQIDPEVTCVIFAIYAIAFISFSGLTNIGIWHWAVYLASIWNFLFHLFSGVLLFLGALWGKEVLKLIYCWLCLVNILSDIGAIIAFAFLYDSVFTIWHTCEKPRNWRIVFPFLHYAYLLFWDIFSPMVILGNLEDDDESDTPRR